MSTLEQVETLRRYADVNYAEAKDALAITEGDMLETMIYLEKHGKANTPKNGENAGTGTYS